MKKAIVIIVYLLSLALLIGLGIWQLQRGLEKQAIEGTAALNNTALKIDDLNALDGQLRYKKVSVTGQLLPQTSFTLANRRHGNRDGVEVFTPLVLENGQTLMVNRGWLSLSALGDWSQTKVPDSVQLSGVIYQPGKGVTIGDAILPEASWPKSSLYLDLDSFSAHIERELSSFVLVLDESNDYAFTQTWKATNMSSQKHFGYAVQWFGLAVTLVIFGFIWLRKKR